MIAYLEGQILSTDSGILVVKTLSGVGYAANTPQPLLVRLKVGDEVVLHVHTQVREDEISLYGFATTAERHLFELLIRTSGVGPKMALGVLSVMLPQELINSVQQGDANRFAQVPGIGKKTATKLCLDMRDQLKKHPVPGLEAVMDGVADFELPGRGPEWDDVYSVLRNQGFTEREILPVLRQVGNGEQSFEVRLKKALSLLNPLR